MFVKLKICSKKKHIKAKTKQMFHFFHERNENQKMNLSWKTKPNKLSYMICGDFMNQNYGFDVIYVPKIIANK